MKTVEERLTTLESEVQELPEKIIRTIIDEMTAAFRDTLSNNQE